MILGLPNRSMQTGLPDPPAQIDPPDPPVDPLFDWLRIATQGLTGASKERIRPEIEAHYAQAVEAHRHGGSTESEAQKSALADLGNPHEAAKRFCKRHLTQRDAKRLEQAHNSAKNILFLLLNYAMFWLYTSGYIIPQAGPRLFTHLQNRWVYFTLQFILSFIIPTAWFVVARWSSTKPNRNLLWLLALCDLQSPLFFYFVLSPSTISFSATVASNVFCSVITFLPLLPHFLISLHTYKKLRKLERFSSYTRPPAPAQT